MYPIDACAYPDECSWLVPESEAVIEETSTTTSEDLRAP